MQTDIDKIDIYFSELSDVQRAGIKKYYEWLIYFNAKINLVSSSTIAYAAKQHFSDSIQGINISMEKEVFNSMVYDFGSGNGFPGLVLGILHNNVEVTLVERDVRKAEFLKHVIGDLALKNVAVYAQGLETLSKNSISLGITRALGSISSVLIQVNSLFKPGGSLFHFKAENWSSEIASCPTQVFTNWDIQPVGQYTLPDGAVERFIIQSKKI